MLISNAHFDAAIIDSVHSILQPKSLLNTYSADVHQGVLYTGGWRTRADIGPDQIYSSPSNNDAPKPLRWNGYDPLRDWHVNDPSVVDAPDGSGRLLMYATGIANGWSSFLNITNHNLTVLAASTDAGATWTWDGVVVDQDNGVDGTGAWSPTALATPASPDGEGKVDLWYGTGNVDQLNGRPVPGHERVMHSVMDGSGKALLSTRAAVRADTGDWLRVVNPDVARGPDGTLWMVGEAYVAKPYIAAYRSVDDGDSWTPWGSGDALPSVIDGKVVRTPSIMGIDPGGAGLTLAYSLTDNANPFDPASDGASHVWTDVIHVAFKAAFSVYGADPAAPKAWVGQSGDDASGSPVGYLTRQYIYTGARDINVAASTPNVFIRSGDGVDALVASSGKNVLDGGSGSNWLVGGSGQDTFFLDARNTGPSTWSTVSNLKRGDMVTLWNVSANSALSWREHEGADPGKGATLHIDALRDGRVNGSLTLAGLSVAQALAIPHTFGTSGGQSYLFFDNR